MKHLIIIKNSILKSRQIEFDSLEELKAAGYNARSFANDFFKDFCVQEITESGIHDTEYRIGEGEEGYRAYCSNIEVDIFTI